MMDSELIKLCGVVHKRTRWDDDSLKGVPPRYGYAPLYTSDYLLEKLPKFILKEGEEYWMAVEPLTEDRWAACYGIKDKPHYDSWADTPLKALLRLTIALDDAGELKSIKDAA